MHITLFSFYCFLLYFLLLSGICYNLELCVNIFVVIIFSRCLPEGRLCVNVVHLFSCCCIHMLNKHCICETNIVCTTNKCFLFIEIILNCFIFFKMYFILLYKAHIWEEHNFNILRKCPIEMLQKIIAVLIIVCLWMCS